MVCTSTMVWVTPARLRKRCSDTVATASSSPSSNAKDSASRVPIRIESIAQCASLAKVAAGAKPLSGFIQGKLHQTLM